MDILFFIAVISLFPFYEKMRLNAPTFSRGALLISGGYHGKKDAYQQLWRAGG